MRAPRWLRRFMEWRWASFVTLLAFALAFAALAVLLIPQQFDGVAPVAQSSRAPAAPALAQAAPRKASLFAAQPVERVPLIAEASPVATPEPAPVAPPVVQEVPPSPPDYAANNADRADRPGSAESAR